MDGSVSVFKNGIYLHTKILEESRTFRVTVYKLNEDIMAIVDIQGDIWILDTDLQE